MILPKARVGQPLLLVRRELDFSFFPMFKTNRRWGLNSMLYAAEPWGVIAGSVSNQIPAGPERKSAQSFVRQAREYFVAAERAGAIETTPLLYYYCFLNIGKALSIARHRSGLVGKVRHGIAQVSSTGYSPSTSELVMQRSGADVSALDELHFSLTGAHVPTSRIPVRELIAQSVVGHRLWREAANRRERFVSVEQVRLRHEVATKRIWATVQVRHDTLSIRRRGVSETVREADLSAQFHAVADSIDGSTEFRDFEQSVPVKYTARPSDSVMDVIDIVRPKLWQTITSAPPYRRYFLYLSPLGEVRLPEWLTIYSALFWLGSMTRYQPVELLELLEGGYGPFFREFLAAQPPQLLYMFASEFRKQEVAKAAVV